MIPQVAMDLILAQLICPKSTFEFACPRHIPATLVVGSKDKRHQITQFLAIHVSAWPAWLRVLQS
jgi:hypothetical protein